MSEVYSKTTPPPEFYTYAYLRKDGTPYYIGKGVGIRAWSHMKRERIKSPTDFSRIVILEAGLTDIGALALERRYISWYGRKDMSTGILRNVTDGGDGSAGATRSEITRRKMGAAKKGNTHSLGIKRTAEQRAANSARQKGAIHSIEQNIRHSIIMTGKKHTPEQNAAKSKLVSSTMWIANQFIRKRIKKTEPIPEGWIRGRTYAFSASTFT